MVALAKGFEALGAKIDSLTIKIDDNYVKKEDFNPVKIAVDSLKLWQAKVFGIAIAVAILTEYLFKIILKY